MSQSTTLVHLWSRLSAAHQAALLEPTGYPLSTAVLTAVVACLQPPLAETPGVYGPTASVCSATIQSGVTLSMSEDSDVDDADLETGTAPLTPLSPSSTDGDSAGDTDLGDDVDDAGASSGDDGWLDHADD